MLSDLTVVAIFAFILAMLVIPLLLGFVLSWITGRRATATNPMWWTFSQGLVALGWGLVLVLGWTGMLTYPASVLVGAMFYVPGLMLLGFHARRRVVS